MNGRLLITACCCLLLSPARAQDRDTTATAEHRNGWTNILGNALHNPAFMHAAYTTSLSEMYLSMSYEQASRPLQAEKGDGHTLGNIAVSSYLKLSPNTTVWGGASYQTGRKRNIRFNSTSDYDQLYPYVMADTIGGDLQNEQYAFSGGYAVKLKQWTFGAEIDFRAEHEYRTIDPRPRGIATDLTLRIGLARAYGNYNMGAGIGMRTYKQTNNVDFYNPLGVVPEYHMTGLGTNYVRFAGAVRSSYYKGTGAIADLQLSPLDASGAYLSIEGSYMPYNNILTELNALPITRLEVSTTAMQAGWKHEGKMRWAAYSGWNMEHRRGNEHIAGSSSSTEYKSLITLSMFRSRKSDCHVGGAIGIGRQSQFMLHARLGWLDDHSEYIDLKREMAFTKTYGRLGWQWLWRRSAQWLLEWNADAACFHNSSRRIVMPYAIMDRQITQLVNDTYAAKTAHLWEMGTQCAVYHHPKQWKGAGIFLRATFAYSHSSFLHQVETNATVGVTF